MPQDQLIQWINEEKIVGVSNPSQAVLSTCSKEAVPHSRVVAIREINEEGLLFFTQRGTKKVYDLNQNPLTSLTFWFEVTQRQVIVEGTVVPLSESESQSYWSTYPRLAQTRFCAYAPTSGQTIKSKTELEEKRKRLESDYDGKEIPMSPFYCGYRIKPLSYSFYLYRTDELSDVYQFLKNKEGIWVRSLLSP